MTTMTWACALPSTVIGVKHELDLAKMKVGECFYSILGTTLTRAFVRDAISICQNFLENHNFQTLRTKKFFNDLNEDFNDDPNDFNDAFINKILHHTKADKKVRLGTAYIDY